MVNLSCAGQSHLGDGGLDGGTVFECEACGSDDGRSKIFFTETFAAAAVSAGADVPALDVLGVRVWHGRYPPLYFAGKVRTDKDLSTKLS